MPTYRGISPEITGGADLGSSTQRWGTLYANNIDPGAQIPGAFNKKETFTTSGSFTAPVTGVYRITLQGGGGGGGGVSGWSGGGGGGSGALIYGYEYLTSGVSYSYVIGAGAPKAAYNTDGAQGGDTSITVNGNTYVAGGGYGGTRGYSTYNGAGGYGGIGKVNDTEVGRGFAGGNPTIVSGAFGTSNSIILGGAGGGAGGGQTLYTNSNPIPLGVDVDGFWGGGGQGAGSTGTTPVNHNGKAGGDGYITFEYYDPSI